MKGRDKRRRAKARRKSEGVFRKGELQVREWYFSEREGVVVTKLQRRDSRKEAQEESKR
jgi:hypothetical protein